MGLAKKLHPEFRRKLNIGLLILVGLQFFSILILNVFFSESEPRRFSRSHYQYQRPVVAPKPPTVVNNKPVSPVAPVKPQNAEKSLQRAPQSALPKTIQPKAKTVRIAKRSGVPHRLPPLKVAKQVRYAKPGKRPDRWPDNWKVIAKAPRGTVIQAER